MLILLVRNVLAALLVLHCFQCGDLIPGYCYYHYDWCMFQMSSISQMDLLEFCYQHYRNSTHDLLFARYVAMQNVLHALKT